MSMLCLQCRANNWLAKQQLHKKELSVNVFMFHVRRFLRGFFAWRGSCQLCVQWSVSESLPLQQLQSLPAVTAQSLCSLTEGGFCMTANHCVDTSASLILWRL